ncbi:Integrator complex subunit 9, partial [Brachionus plicatilis]
MATFFKTPFNISSESYFIEAKVSKVGSSSSNIICCVDVSGSMSGSPIRNVCQVLRDIYKRTQIDYSLFTYNTSADTTKTIKSIENYDLNAGGGTSFSSIFTAVQNHLVRNQKSTTFIFMTDGDDTDSQERLKKSIQMLKLTLSGLPKTMTVTFHVIGFGNVNNYFLEQVRTFGNKDGLFRYSTESAELQNNFNDMFEYAMSAREFTLVLNGKSYTSNSNEETVAFLIDDNQIDESITNEIILKSPEGETKMVLDKLENPRPIHIVRALN